jgi:hypothetical protein
MEEHAAQLLMKINHHFKLFYLQNARKASLEAGHRFHARIPTSKPIFSQVVFVKFNIRQGLHLNYGSFIFNKISFFSST